MMKKENRLTTFLKNNPGVVPIFLLLFLFIFTFLMTAQENENQENKNKDVVKHMKRALFMAQKDLYDGRLLLEYSEEIGLTANQVKKIENMMLEYEESSMRIGAEIKILELQFATYVKSDQVDRKQIEQLIRDINKKKTRGVIDYMNYLLDLKEILTPSQLEKVRVQHKQAQAQKNKKEQNIKN